MNKNVNNYKDTWVTNSDKETNKIALNGMFFWNDSKKKILTQLQKEFILFWGLNTGEARGEMSACIQIKKQKR